MITKDNFKQVLESLSFTQNDGVYTKKFEELDCELKVDFKNEKLIFPEDKGMIVNDKTTSNFSNPENFVVFECVYRLLLQGYHPRHIELEKKWQLGHSQKSGKADIFIKDNDDNSLLIIECKTAGYEYKKAISILENDSRNQLFSYLQQATSTKFLSLYTSDFGNGEVDSNYYLINATDNEELLKNDENLKSYKEATTTEQKYQVWCNTYDKEYATVGIFEDNKPYDIGKTKFTIKDLQDISPNYIKSVYHTFATIMRQHNVSGRENAFDRLVNLFLCKVTDEEENPNELKFRYKGKAYDTPFDFQDRLQNLYKTGMGKFLNDEITYIPNDKIDEAFDVFKDNPLATKDQIKKFVRELKFFTNNDFAFIEVHNEKLFHQNFEILLKVSKMIEDLCLTCSQQNQLLGDMFEGFLDQGIKQSEGQFFTPIPIVKFIINSLPEKETPKVIDYACGAGHFLNEYALDNPDSEIVGIEKEYRLSKVSKISSFMYGRDMDIIYSDALLDNKKLHLKNEDFDVLIANPPYSVKGFLQTLSEEDRQNYELIDSVDSKSYGTNNAIECFFIERAKQLLRKDAIAGVIVPSSLLNKESKLYIKTREIILKYFDIVAIAEFGSSTFGKTPTTTVTLFLRKKGTNPDLSKHYENMADSWFECNFELNEAFKDNYILEKYCSHIEIDFEGYKNLLCDKLDGILFENETFKEYKDVFEKSTETKTRKKKKYYKGLSKEEKDSLEQKELIKFIKAIEKDKLIYFALASKQDNDVVIVKSPSKTNEIKKFLGYEWDGRKGNEGIKYLTSSNTKTDLNEDELDVDDKRVIENLQGLKSINTPLYNPLDSEDSNKINKIIKDNFSNIKTFIPEHLGEFVTRASLIDMLDFSRVDFNKAISLAPKIEQENINTKWSSEKLGKVAPYVTEKTNLSDIELSSYVSTDNLLQNRQGVIEVIDKPNVDKVTQYKKNDILVSNIRPYLKKIWFADKDGGCSNDVLVFRSSNINHFLPKYIFYILSTNRFFEHTMADAKGLKMPRGDKKKIPQFLVPAPPISVQEEIIQECVKIDSETNKANHIIQDCKEQIEHQTTSANVKTEKLSSLVKTNPSKREISKIDNETIVSFIEMASVTNDGHIETKVDRPLEELRKGSFKYFQEDDIIIAKITPSMENGKCAIATDLTNGLGMGSSEFHVIRVTGRINNKFLFAYLNREEIRVEAQKHMTGSSGHKRVPIEFYENLQIPLPSIEAQLAIVAKINELEKNIFKAKEVIKNAESKKEEILEKYLK